MSVALVTTPQPVSFSADNIIARFACTNYLSQAGIASVNEIDFSAGFASATIKYGLRTIQMNAKAPSSVDDSGNDFSNVDIASALLGFKSNYQLSKDFDITAQGSKIIFTAKAKALGFNFSSGGINTIAGRADVKLPNYGVYFKLYLEKSDYSGFEVIYETTLQVQFGSSAIAEAQIGDKLHAKITETLRKEFPDQPQIGVLECGKSCRKFYFEFAESYGDQPVVRKLSTSATYTVIHGGLSTIAQFNKTVLSLIAPSTPENDRFLKQGNSSCYTRTNQPQYLYFLNTRTSLPAARFQAKFTYSDGSTYTWSVLRIGFDSFRKYAYNVQFDHFGDIHENKTAVKYEVWIDDNNGVHLSEIRTFYLDYSSRTQVRYFISWSSFGSLDSRVCYGKSESEYELFNNTAKRVVRAGDDIKAGSSLTFDSKINRSFTVATGWMNRHDLLLNADFFLSNFKYRYTGGLMLPIYIAPGKIPEIKDQENLLAQQFEYKYHFDDHNYTEGDAEDTGVSISNFFFSSASVASPSGITETDPTVPAWVKSITAADISKWNQAFVAGLNQNNFSGSYYDLQNKPTSLSQFTNDLGNYGNWITDAQASAWTIWGAHFDGNGNILGDISEIRNLNMTGIFAGCIDLRVPLSRAVSISAGSLWIGDGATAGNPGSAVEYPLTFTSPLLRTGNNVTITGYNNANWDTAYSWGNHAGKYPTYTGVGASGSWSISITGNAATASKWNAIAGTPWTFDDSIINGSGISLMWGRDSSNPMMRQYNAAAVKTFLGLDTAAYKASTAFMLERVALGTGTMNFVRNTQSGVYRNENGMGGNQSFSPVLHMNGDDTCWQIQADYNTSSNSLRFRGGLSGSYGPWRLVWHDGNFSPSNYMSLTGGTLTGGLTVNSRVDSYGFLLRSNNSTLQFESAASSDLFISCIPDTRIVEIRNGNATSPNYGACGIVTGSGDFRTLLSGSRISAGYDSGVAGSVNASNWLRSNGTTGWINDTYGGGIYMNDVNTVRVYNDKNFATSASMYVDNGQFRSTGKGFKSFNECGLVGDYDTNSSSNKIIFTIGDGWNTYASMWGLGYSYNSKFNQASHQITFVGGGTVRAMIDLQYGDGKFDGSLTATSFYGMVRSKDESTFCITNFTDPHPSYAHAIKIGGSGIAVNGDSYFNNNLYAPIVIPTARPATPVAGSLWIA